jgi:hypothetical protein
MRHNKQRLIIATIVVAVLLVPAIIWIGLGYAGDPNSVKLPAVSTIGPEMKPYVLTALEKEKRLLPVKTQSIPMDFADVGTAATPSAKSDPNAGLTQAERDKLAQWKNKPHEKQQWTPEKVEPFSTIENIPRARGIEGLTPQERAKLETYMESQNQ